MEGLLGRKKLLESIRNQRRLAEREQKVFTKCAVCGAMVELRAFEEALNTCLHCGEHHEISGKKRFEYLLDRGYRLMSFGAVQRDPIVFPGYRKKLKELCESKNLSDAISVAVGSIRKHPVCAVALEPSFLMGSMGTYLGEELSQAFEYALKKKIPILVISASGGARMQEGIFSLMQMAKTAAVVQRLAEKKLLYISLLANPTMGGVSASFAFLGDVILAEPRALIGFAGPRVIEQTMRQRLPDGFQRAEKLVECGFVDAIAPRGSQRELIARILKLHSL